MKFISLVAGLALAAVMGAAPVHAESKAKDDPAFAKEQRARGAKEAPALLQAAGVTCTPTDATFRGSGKTADKGTIDIYEAVCHEGLGYILLKTGGGAAAQAFDCLAASTGATKCILPGNADPKQGLAPAIAAAGHTCAISDARYIGTSTATRQNFYEVACGTAPGYRLGVPRAEGKPEAIDCLALLDGESACKLTSKELAMSTVNPFVTASGRTCPMSGARYVGSSAQSNTTYYEVACGPSGGFMAVADATTGVFKQAIDCAKAANIAGGCKLTDTTVSETAEIGVYTRLAAKAGFPCAVSKYRYIGQDSKNREIVELACKDRPDGAIAAFSDQGASEVYDCVRSGALGQGCQLSSPAPVFARYTAALEAKGRGSCKVSNAIWLGSTNTGEWIETACADGAPGWVIEGLANNSGAIHDLLSCRQATSAGLACKLPTNIAANKGS